MTVFALLSSAAIASSTTTAQAVPDFWVRPGYSVTAATDTIPGTRFLEVDDAGQLYISRPSQGNIVVLTLGADRKYTIKNTFVSGYNSVHAMDWHDGWLWFAQTGTVRKARDTNGDGQADEIVDVLTSGSIPSGGGHWYRSLLVTDQHLYTSIGDSGNITDESATDRQKIWRYNHDGTGKTLWSSGIRNTEKLRLRPGTSEVWGIDHGSDNFGGPLGESSGNRPVTDLNPPCEVNHYEEGKDYGHPFIVGTNIPRYEYMDRGDILTKAANAVPPAWNLGAHYAPNGFTFMDGSMGREIQGDMFVACHGSWNSSVKVGYRIERVLFDKHLNKPYGSQMVVGTLAPNGTTVLGRPVDCVVDGQGAILFSCDFTNRVYRLTYQGSR